MREIQLTRGYATLVDDEDYEWLSANKWNADVHKDGRVYARRLIYLGLSYRSDGKRVQRQRVLRMHVAIMEHLGLAVPGKYVDHRNGDGLDNRRLNLRVADNSLNIANAKKRCDAVSSRFKGVAKQRKPALHPWIAAVRGRRLGCFATEEEAARAYDAAAKAEFGEFARVNFPEGI